MCFNHDLNKCFPTNKKINLKNVQSFVYNNQTIPFFTSSLKKKYDSFVDHVD